MTLSARHFISPRVAAAAFAGAAAFSLFLLFYLCSGTRESQNLDSSIPSLTALTKVQTEDAGELPPSYSQPLTALASQLLPPPPPAPGELARRFRFVGPLRFGDGLPLAVLDDKVQVKSIIAWSGLELAPGVSVVSVEEDSIVLLGPSGEEKIFQEKITARKTPSVPSAAPVESVQADTIPSNRMEAAERFGGEEIFPGRWHFDREKLLSYYDELCAEPSADRLQSIFDSMEPEWIENAEGEPPAIDGYRVHVLGEPAFFMAAGLEEGDIVRSVNSQPLTNRKFAEAQIWSFVEGRGSMYVLEIERNGKRFKQIFEFE